MEKNLNRANFCAELSNLGIFSLPEQEETLVKMFKVLLTQSTNNDIRSTVALEVDTMAKEQAISGRFLMGIKRSGKFKARGSIDGMSSPLTPAERHYSLKSLGMAGAVQYCQA